MAPKGTFENNFEDYSEATALTVLNETQDAISSRFHTKLQKYTDAKLHFLTTELASDIFYDNTVYTGSAGLALYYFMSALKKKETYTENLRNALLYLNINNLKGRRISFLCGDAGPLALATVISYKLGKDATDLPDYKTLAQRLTSLMSLLNASPDELLYGKSGYLYALLFVNKYIDERSIIPPHLMEKVIFSILKSGKEYSEQVKSSSPLLWHWHDKVYLGGAHGVAGILYILLQAQAHISANDMQNFIKPTLDWLLNQKFPSGNFPSSLKSASGDRLVQWCHGAPGFVPLLILAYQIFGDDKYIKTALQCGNAVWDRGLTTKGYSICHGVSGNAYTFIQLYQVTKQPIHLYRACCFTEWCCLERSGTELQPPERPASLFEGLVGRLLLARDMQAVQLAHFPAYTV
ncbi:lanC-like protein 2 [Leguminivora glycinivorella]|uniref:lanC-like protein 2 n=1 Tax=Leguminivora glycinivorella TaxID=1035111 RepID=UPI00200BC622|nr:lanC-like protein 2 [Leguminivora glycinivorella]